ncbi:Asx homology domain-containing protein [Trichophaea hybrida]|nr:Asx homology domain-containing protein [Trichophaea hybrida]
MDRPRRTSRRVIPDVTHHPSPSPEPTAASIPQKRTRTISPSPAKSKRGRKVSRPKGKGKIKSIDADVDEDDNLVISDLIKVDDGFEATKKRRRGGGKQATAPEVEIPSEPARRSGRNRAPPRDPYIEGLAVEAKKPTRPRVAPKPRKKKMAAEELWAPENLVTKNSPYITADLSKILNAQVLSRANMSADDYNSLIALLPAEDILYPTNSDLSAADPAPIINPALFDSVFFKEGIRNYQFDLSCGKYEPEYIAKGEQARKRRMTGEFDAWKDAQFELHWGDKQKFYHDAVAGESSKVKLADLVKHHQFKVGDVFSMRRSFAGGLAVRKDAVLTSLCTTEGTLDFSYPPGTAEWTRAGVADKTTENVVSLTALEALLLKEDGRAPEKLPNGNAFKTIRVIRKGEDIGCVFDVRAKFWGQYLKGGEDEE